MGPTSTSASKEGRNLKPEKPELLQPDFSHLSALREHAQLYWVGMITHRAGDPERPHPPFHAVTVGGVTFPSWHTPWIGDEPSPDGDVAGGRQRYPGYLVELTESKVADLKHALRRTVVRWHDRKGLHAHGRKITLINEDDVNAATEKWALTPKQRQSFLQKARSFTILEGDEPLGKFIYCVPVTEKGVKEGDRYRPSPHIPACVLETGIPNPGE